MVDQAGRDVHQVTSALPGQHRGDGAAGHLEEAPQVDSSHGVIVLVGVVGERLGDEDAGIVDDGVDPAEAGQGRVHDAGANAPRGHVAGRGQYIRIIRLADRAGVRDHGVTKLAVGGDQGGADALGGPGDDRHLLD